MNHVDIIHQLKNTVKLSEQDKMHNSKNSFKEQFNHELSKNAKITQATKHMDCKKYKQMSLQRKKCD